MPYDINALKNKIKEYSGKRSDPDEFRPQKAKAGEKLKYKFYVLPGLVKGDKLKTSIVEKSMDIFFINYGQHWVKNAPHACPRIWDGSECQMCEMGLELLRDKKLTDQERLDIRRDWLPSSAYVVNIYFPPLKSNPEELRGKVLYYKAPKTLFDVWSACITRDPIDPEEMDDIEEFEPSGVFFDENAAWLFELNVELNGKSNGYKASKFLVGSDKRPQPIVKKEDGSPDTKAIASILSHRIDIWGRLELPDSGKIKKLYNSLLHGDDDDSAGSGFDVDEEEKPSKASRVEETDSKKMTKKASSFMEDEDEAPKAKARARQEEDEEPAPKSSSKSSVPFADDDDDDDLKGLWDKLNDE